MQAVLLAAGESSRFFPFNNKHKCLVKIAGEPLVVHTVRAVKRAGITDIIFITGDHNDFKDVLGNGKKLGVKIRYVVQKEPTGAGDAVLLASGLISSDFFLINSNHVEFDELKKAIDEKRGTNKNAVLLARKSSGKHFGVLKVEEDRVLSIVEKPKSNRGLSNLRVIGVYFLNQEFIDILKNLKREHYSLEKALDIYARDGKVRFATIDTEILTLKYPWDLLAVKDYILKKIKRSISKKASISKSAQIQGDVVIEDGAQIAENSVIKGPAYIGKNSFIGSNTLIRNSSDIEENCTVGAYMEIRGSLILPDTKTHSGFIGDSVIGQNSRVGALFGSANVRLDRKNINVEVKGKRINSGLRSLGVMMGSNVIIGERVSTMPGVIIGNNVNIGPSTTVMKNIPENNIFYTKFKEIIQKNRPASPKITSRGGAA